MESKPLLERCRDAVVLLFLCALGLRVAAWLIAPVLPVLGAMFIVVVIGYLLLSGPRHGR
jgi:hypothetical protein